MRGYLFGVPHNQDYNILGSILGSPYLGKLPFTMLLLSLVCVAFHPEACAHAECSGCLRLQLALFSSSGTFPKLGHPNMDPNLL